MDYLVKDLGSLGHDDVVEVTLDHPANVQLLDPENYAAYREKRAYRYHGGHATESPFRIRVPYSGAWYLVIDLGGGPGTVRASVRLTSNVPT